MILKNTRDFDDLPVNALVWWNQTLESTRKLVGLASQIL